MNTIKRKRFIDHRIWTDEKLLKLTFNSRVLYIGLITIADDFGCFNNDLGQLKNLIFPNDFYIEKVLQFFQELLEEGLVVATVYNDKEIFWIRKWFKYQYLQGDNKTLFGEIKEEKYQEFEEVLIQNIRTEVTLNMPTIISPFSINIQQLPNNTESKSNQDEVPPWFDEDKQDDIGPTNNESKQDESVSPLLTKTIQISPSVLSLECIPKDGLPKKKTIKKRAPKVKRPPKPVQQMLGLYPEQEYLVFMDMFREHVNYYAKPTAWSKEAFFKAREDFSMEDLKIALRGFYLIVNENNFYYKKGLVTPRFFLCSPDNIIRYFTYYKNNRNDAATSGHTSVQNVEKI